jgi:hypothetical protein
MRETGKWVRKEDELGMDVEVSGAFFPSSPSFAVKCVSLFNWRSMTHTTLPSLPEQGRRGTTAATPPPPPLRTTTTRTSISQTGHGMYSNSCRDRTRTQANRCTCRSHSITSTRHSMHHQEDSISRHRHNSNTTTQIERSYTFE